MAFVLPFGGCAIFPEPLPPATIADAARANLQSSHAGMLFSIVSEPYGPIEPTMSVAALASVLRSVRVEPGSFATSVAIAAPSAVGPEKIN